MSLIKKLAFGSLLLTLAYCGSNNSSDEFQSKDQKIINGTAVESSSSPQIIELFIQFADGSNGICSGTVIGDNDVLTAGHCFVQPITSAQVVKGDGTVAEVSSVNIHPGYREDASVNAIFFDVAIAKTNIPLNLPVLGILASQSPQASEMIGIYGFGLDENQTSGVLRGGNMQIDQVTPNHIFAVFDNLSNTCSGDSGGPATYNVLDPSGNISAVGVVGITSSGSVEDCGPGDLSLFTNIQHPDVLSFIATLVPEAAFL